MKNTRLIIGLLSIILFAYNAVNAADKQFSVLVSVPYENEFTGRVKSFVSRELRELPDVKLVDKLSRRKGEYFISIVAVPLKLASGATVGIAVSYVFQEGDWIGHNVLAGSPDDLKSLCEKIVSTFDIDLLEPSRHK